MSPRDVRRIRRAIRAEILRTAGVLLRVEFAVVLMLLARLDVMGAYENLKELFEHIFGLSEKWAFKSKCYLALLTGTPATSGNKGVTMKKVKEKETTVTGYSRFLLANEAAHGKTKVEASGEEKAIFENTEAATIQTGLSGANQEILYWAIVQESSGEAGKVIAWGSCTGVSIGGTGTPVELAANKLKVEIA